MTFLILCGYGSSEHKAFMCVIRLAGTLAPGLFVSMAGHHLNSQKISKGEKKERLENGF